MQWNGFKCFSKTNSTDPRRRVPLKIGSKLFFKFTGSVYFKNRFLIELLLLGNKWVEVGVGGGDRTKVHMGTLWLNMGPSDGTFWVAVTSCDLTWDHMVAVAHCGLTWDHPCRDGPNKSLMYHVQLGASTSVHQGFKTKDWLFWLKPRLVDHWSTTVVDHLILALSPWFIHWSQTKACSILTRSRWFD